ncbi:hypothetical protein CYMTET_26456, partial [Cymbomonas tetramitiformis]
PVGHISASARPSDAVHMLQINVAMKFGKELKGCQVEKYRGYYLQYKLLKNQLKKSLQRQSSLELLLHQSSDQFGTDAAESTFLSSLESDITKVETFLTSKGYQIKNTCFALIDLAVNVEEAIKSGNTEIEKVLLKKLSEKTDEMCEEVDELDKFRQLNYIAVSKIVKKAAKNLGARNFSQAEHVSRLRGSIWQRPLENLVLPLLSQTYSLLRGQKNSEQAWVPPQTFERSTKKYWVKRADLVKLNLLLVKHLPILLFGQKKTLRDLRMDFLADKSLEHSTWITSVYYDSDQHTLYGKRLQREEGARLLRLRWYGLSPEKSIFVERKTHHEAWVGEGSLKERFELKTKHAANYFNKDYDIWESLQEKIVKGELSQESAEKAAVLAREVKTMHTELNLKPSVRSVYKRTAFQLSDSNKVRVTLDTSLHLSDETNLPEKQLWRNMDEHLDCTAICAFPYNILEIKLQDAAPPFIQHLLEGGMLTEVTKFSKFLSGCAILHPGKLSMLPHWMDDAAVLEAIASNTSDYNSFPAKEDCVRPAVLMPYSPEPSVSPQKVPNEALLEAENLSALRSGDSAQDGRGVSPYSHRHPHLILPQTRPLKSASVDSAFLGYPSKRASSPGNLASAAPMLEMDTGRSTSTNGWSKYLPPCCRWRNQSTSKVKVLAARTVAKIEPKTYFANERTFIQWLSAAALLVSLSIILVGEGGDTARTCGFLVMPVAAADPWTQRTVQATAGGSEVHVCGGHRAPSP